VVRMGECHLRWANTEFSVGTVVGLILPDLSFTGT
jgi:hypothetical protein